jgi:hypothetical protein
MAPTTTTMQPTTTMPIITYMDINNKLATCPFYTNAPELEYNPAAAAKLEEDRRRSNMYAAAAQQAAQAPQQAAQAPQQVSQTPLSIQAQRVQQAQEIAQQSQQAQQPYIDRIVAQQALETTQPIQQAPVQTIVPPRTLQISYRQHNNQQHQPNSVIPQATCYDDRVPCFPHTTIDECKIRCSQYPKCRGFSVDNRPDINGNRTCTFMSSADDNNRMMGQGSTVYEKIWS